MDDTQTLGDVIRERRLARGFSLGQLATKLGQTAAAVRSWERGAAEPDADTLESLAVALDVEPEILERFADMADHGGGVESDDSPRTGQPAAVDEREAVDEPEAVAAADEPAEPMGDREGAEGVVAGVELLDDGLDELDLADIAAYKPTVDEADVTEDPGDTELEASDDVVAENAEVSDTATDEAAESPDAATDEAAEVPGAATDGAAESPATTDEAAEVPDAATEEAAEVPDAATDEAGSRADVVPPYPGADEIVIPTATSPDPELSDLPTEAIGPPLVLPVATPAVAPAGTATLTAVGEDEAADSNFRLTNPFHVLFDPSKTWLYWIRAALTVVLLLIMARLLLWAISELWDAIIDVLGSFRSTDEVDRLINT